MKDEIIKNSGGRKANVVQDVVPPQKRSIRNVELPSRRRIQNNPNEIKDIPKIPKRVADIAVKSNPVPPPLPPPIRPVKETEFEPEPENHSYTYDYSEPKKSSKKFLYIAAGIFVLVLLFGVSAFFKSAKITITPKNQAYNLNANFTATKDATSGGLSFQIVTITKDVEKTVPATGQKQVDTKAGGTIVIFNNTAQPQKLVATTRFQTPEGLIYRLISATTVPAQQVKSGKTVAGSVEATVAADASGDKYNVGLEDFTIPGFKGTSKYTQIYARSKTEMSGGFSGMQKVVSQDVMDQTGQQLESSLKETLASDIVSQIPANFVMYQNGISYSLSTTTQVGSNDAGAILQDKGTAYAIIFDKGSLTRAIVGNILPDVSGDVIKITNLDKLVFAYPAGTAFSPSGSATTLNFNLSGSANFVWVFDENKLKSDLLGLSKTQAREVIGQNSSITEVWLETSPFWNQTIPTDAKKVTLVNTLAQ